MGWKTRKDKLQSDQPDGDVDVDVAPEVEQESAIESDGVAAIARLAQVAAAEGDSNGFVLDLNNDAFRTDSRRTTLDPSSFSWFAKKDTVDATQPPPRPQNVAPQRPAPPTYAEPQFDAPSFAQSKPAPQEVETPIYDEPDFQSPAAAPAWTAAPAPAFDEPVFDTPTPKFSIQPVMNGAPYAPEAEEIAAEPPPTWAAEPEQAIWSQEEPATSPPPAFADPGEDLSWKPSSNGSAAPSWSEPSSTNGTAAPSWSEPAAPFAPEEPAPWSPTPGPAFQAEPSSPPFQPAAQAAPFAPTPIPPQLVPQDKPAEPAPYQSAGLASPYASQPIPTPAPAPPPAKHSTNGQSSSFYAQPAAPPPSDGHNISSFSRESVAPGLVSGDSEFSIPKVAPFIVAGAAAEDEVQTSTGDHYLIIRMRNLAASHKLAKDVTTIGRPDSITQNYPDVEIELDDGVSRKHAEIRRKNGEYFVADVGSTNGTLLNGDLLDVNNEMKLAHGDRIRVGERTEIVFE